MSDPDTPRDRSNAPSARDKSPPKRKGRGRGGEPKRSKTPDNTPQLPFMEADEFSNVTIKVGEKRIYSNDGLLAYSSTVLCEELCQKENASTAGGKGAKGKPALNADKELDWSDKDYGDVCDVMSFIDPRVDYDVKDEDVPRLAPIAQEYKLKGLLKECERTITRSFHIKNKKRRLDMAIILQHLEIADSCNFNDLNRMCIDACVSQNNPYVNKQITESPRIAEKTKIDILTRKLDRMNRRTISKDSSRMDIGERGSNRSLERK